MSSTTGYGWDKARESVQRDAVEPLRDRVVLRRSSPETKTPGGLHIPANVDVNAVLEGEILAVGKGAVFMDGTTCPMIVKVGDKVLFLKGIGAEIRVHGEPLWVLRENDILCIVR